MVNIQIIKGEGARWLCGSCRYTVVSRASGDCWHCENKVEHLPTGIVIRELQAKHADRQARLGSSAGKTKQKRARRG